MKIIFPLGKEICFVRDREKTHVFIVKTTNHAENDETNRVSVSDFSVESMGAKNNLQSSILADKDTVRITFTLKGEKK